MSATESSDEEASEHEHAAQELELAIRANDTPRVHHLFKTTSLDRVDTAKHVDMYQNVPLMRCLLEHGADPNSCSLRGIKSLEILKLLAEFGFDMISKGHTILQ